MVRTGSKIAAQALPGTAALSQWLDEIATLRIVERLDRLEDPLTKYGLPLRIKKLTSELYSLLQKQSQDVPTTHLGWTPQLDDFKKEMRHLEADGLLDGSHRLGPGGEFGAGFRLSGGFIVLLAVLHGNRTEISKLVEAIETARTQLDGSKCGNKSARKSQRPGKFASISGETSDQAPAACRSPVGWHCRCPKG